MLQIPVSLVFTLASIGISASLLSLLLKLGDDLDKVSPRFSAIIKNHMGSASDKAKWGRISKSLRLIIPEMFSIVYGKNPLSFRFFLRSIFVSSLFWISITTASLATETYIAIGSWHLNLILAAFSITGLFFLSVNIFGDYLSLIVTRFFIGKLTEKRSLKFLIFCVISDYIISVTILALSYHYVFSVRFSSVALHDGQLSLKKLLGEIIYFLSLSKVVFFVNVPGDVAPVLLIQIMTGLVTSLWIWLAVLTSFIASIVPVYPRFLGKLLSFFDFENRPAHSLSVAVCIMLSILAILSLLARLAIGV